MKRMEVYKQGGPMKVVDPGPTLTYGLVLLGYIVLRPLYTRLMKKLLSLTKTEVDDKLFWAVEKPTWIGILIILTDYFLRTIFFDELLHGTLLTVAVIFFTIALLRLGRVLIYEVLGSTRFLLVDKKTRQTALSVLSNLYIATIVFFAVIYIFSLWGISITPLLASAGFFGLVLGLALKDPFENLISGILLLADPPFRVGDWVKVNEIFGEVKEIGLRNTRILSFDGNLVTLPNSSVVNSVVTDYHLPDDRVRIRLKVGVSYDSDPEKVKEVLLSVLRSDKRVLRDPEPKVFFVEMGDFALIFEVWFWVRARDMYETRSDINTKIFYELKRKGIEIPFPTRTVYLKNL